MPTIQEEYAQILAKANIEINNRDSGAMTEIMLKAQLTTVNGPEYAQSAARTIDRDLKEIEKRSPAMQEVLTEVRNLIINNITNENAKQILTVGYEEYSARQDQESNAIVARDNKFEAMLNQVKPTNEDRKLMQEMYNAALDMHQRPDNDDRASLIKINDCMLQLKNEGKEELIPKMQEFFKNMHPGKMGLYAKNIIGLTGDENSQSFDKTCDLYGPMTLAHADSKARNTIRNSIDQLHAKITEAEQNPGVLPQFLKASNYNSFKQIIDTTTSAKTSSNQIVPSAKEIEDTIIKSCPPEKREALKSALELCKLENTLQSCSKTLDELNDPTVKILMGASQHTNLSSQIKEANETISQPTADNQDIHQTLETRTKQAEKYAQHLEQTEQWIETQKKETNKDILKRVGGLVSSAIKVVKHAVSSGKDEQYNAKKEQYKKEFDLAKKSVFSQGDVLKGLQTLKSSMQEIKSTISSNIPKIRNKNDKAATVTR